MNKWECDQDGCRSAAVGVKSAIGLRAIGWYFRRGTPSDIEPVILCPRHRPDPIPCTDKSPYPCELCAAYKEADLVQELLKAIDDLNELIRTAARMAGIG